MPKVSWRRALPVILVGLLLVTSVLLVADARFRRGAACLALALALAGLMRAFIDPERLGPLVVRSKAFDVVFCLGMAVFIVLLTV